MRVSQAQHLAVAGGLQRRTACNLRRLIACNRSEVGWRAVGEDDVLFEDVVDRLAVEHRAGAARVVGHHAADGGAAGGRDVGREAQSVRLELGVQFVEDDTRFDDGPALGDVEVEDAIAVLRGVNLQPLSDGLPGLRRPSASHRQRAAVAGTQLDDTDDVVTGARDDDAERTELVDGGVGRVECARHRIEAGFSRQRPLEIAAEAVDIHRGGGRLERRAPCLDCNHALTIIRMGAW